MSDDDKLLDKIEKLYVLQAHKDDAIIIEYNLAATSEEELSGLYDFLEEAGFHRVYLIGMRQGCGPLRISAVSNEGLERENV